jgi:hypothetical protein
MKRLALASLGLFLILPSVTRAQVKVTVSASQLIAHLVKPYPFIPPPL